jgi:hypothetical protein
MKALMLFVLFFVTACGDSYIAEKREGLKPEKERQAQEEEKAFSR